MSYTVIDRTKELNKLRIQNYRKEFVQESKEQMKEWLNIYANKFRKIHSDIK
jgi:hypothetical protein